MDHDLRVGQCEPLALGTRREQECTHRSCHTDTDGGNITFDVLHGIIDCHTSGYRTAGAVDIQLDILIRVLAFQIEQLSHYQTGTGIGYFLAQHNDSVIEQSGENIIGTLSTVGLLYDHRN